jgi:hypothetical protein
MAAPVERKVQASTAAAATSGLALWIIGRYLFKGDVPDVVASWIYVAIPAAVTFAAGFAARHTARPAPAWAAKTLVPPAAAAAEQPPAAAGPAEPAVPE